MRATLHLATAFAATWGVAAGAAFANDEERTMVIGLIGDSTVAETCGWGPAFAKRFDDGVTVLNAARNGARLDSLSEGLDELLKEKPDLVLIQFGHNDQKEYGVAEYRRRLTDYIERIKAAGARPIVLSPVTRRVFGADGKIQPRTEGVKATLAELSDAAQQVAAKETVHFIHLYGISVHHHNELGPAASAKYDFQEGDRTHFSPHGAAATAELVLDELKVDVPPVAFHILRDRRPAN